MISNNPSRLNHLLWLPLICTSLLLAACKNNDSSAAHLQNYQTRLITLPSQEQFFAYLADTASKRNLGLSGIKTEDFADNDSMLFSYKSTADRQFWMPDTYFDLDVFFLDEEFRVIDVHRQLKHFPHSVDEGKDVPRSKIVASHYALEIKSTSPLAHKLRPGMTLQVSGDH